MKIIKHFITITKHRILVCKYCFKLGLIYQGLTHDLSKYSFTEFFRGAKYYQGVRSPNDYERELFGYSLAWMHHKGRNKHHFEYWNDFDSKVGEYVSIKMPLKYVKEMICDRIAASKIYQKKNYTDASALNYLTRKPKPARMHQETYDFLIKVLTMLKDDGEKKTFKYLKKLKEY